MAATAYRVGPRVKARDRRCDGPEKPADAPESNSIKTNPGEGAGRPAPRTPPGVDRTSRAGHRHAGPRSALTTQRKPICPVDVSTASPWRAAGR